MPGQDQSRVSHAFSGGLLATVGALLLSLVSVAATAQLRGIPPSVTSIPNHLPPYLPNIPPSVTSLGPFGYVGPPAFPVFPPPYSNQFLGNHGHRYKNGYGYSGYGGAYIVPYYFPAYDTYDMSGSDPASGGGPYLYSGPPPDPPSHVVVDLPPEKRSVEADDEVTQGPKAGPAGESEVLPLEATVLVFRDGHEQHVTNYAVMGQTIYVFDDHKQKISLGDLDLPATIKVNGDRGVDFQLPNRKRS